MRKVFNVKMIGVILKTLSNDCQVGSIEEINIITSGEIELDTLKDTLKAYQIRYCYKISVNEKSVYLSALYDSVNNTLDYTSSDNRKY